MTKACNIRQVNRAITEAGMDSIELVRGDGYFYFFGKNVDDVEGGVYVYSIRQLSIEQWIEEAEHRYTKYRLDGGN